MGNYCIRHLQIILIAKPLQLCHSREEFSCKLVKKISY